jgi:hypothetical protein
MEECNRINPNRPALPVGRAAPRVVATAAVKHVYSGRKRESALMVTIEDYGYRGGRGERQKSGGAVGKTV